MSDEEFHEIQLNGKQLVFLFMAATVVAVVIFLCGVMVGRGVPTRATAPSNTPEQAAFDPTAVLGVPTAPAVANDDGAPLTAQETLTYPTLLEDPNPPFETLAPASEPPRDPEPPARRVEPAPKPLTPAAPKPAAALPPKPADTAVEAPARPAGRDAGSDVGFAEPSGNGFVVQVAAVRQRAEATTIARRLSGKGYPAFVTTSGANFRVRVGKFNDRREAETVAGRLEREEQFKPWITR
jgi:cell division septation protein DedD